MKTAAYRTIDSADIVYTVSSILNNMGLGYKTTTRKLWGTKEEITFTLDLPMTALGDTIKPQIKLINSYDRECALRLFVGVFRLICMNGLFLGDMFFEQKIIHKVGPTGDVKLDELPDQICRAVAYIKADLESDLEEINQPLTEEQMIQVTGNLRVPKRVKEEVIDDIVTPYRRRQEDSDNNVWTLYNIVNENIRHRTRSAGSEFAHNTNLLFDVVELSKAA